ncbi:MAG: DUF3857 domain-containing protein [Candidatus Krumholzibacteria bacterium]|jgi:hypothetical protein|nr:DUF3857 domain-containing protein [Candidatus Krumholzibacteria bacterium]
MTTTTRGSLAVLLLTGALLAPSPARAQAMGISYGHDLDALWAQAQAQYDLARWDAVLLLESRAVNVTGAPGEPATISTRVHRVVWIGTSVGLSSHADLRVPWNEATSALAVETLRTWRDGRWWPDPVRISETAVVPTLPYALDRAHDYTTMRETMLLHDGVELPCILETAYTITERLPAAAGAGMDAGVGGGSGTSGLFVIPQRDPAVLTEYKVQVPAGVDLRYEVWNDAPAPRVHGDGARSFTWRIDGSPALRWPTTARPLLHEPAILWSTWPDRAWQAAWRAAFDAAAVAGPELLASPRLHLEKAAGGHALVDAAAAFVAEAIRPIRYDDRFWRLAPRSADRTWATGYASALDRAIVYAAVLREWGCVVQPVYLVDVPASQSAMLPEAAEWAGDLCLLVEAGSRAGMGAVTRMIDVGGGTVHDADDRPAATRLIIAPDGGVREPRGEPGRLAVTLVLEPGDADAWRGTGEIAGRGACELHGAVVTGKDGLDKVATAILAGVLPGATATRTAPRRLDAATSVLEFDVEVPAPKQPAGDHRLQLGAPQGGARDALPRDVHVVDAQRTSPVLLAAPFVQIVAVRLRLDGREVRHLPSERRLDNRAGTFAVDAVNSDDWLTYRRTLELSQGRIEPRDWPDLRALLLEEMDAANGMIILGNACPPSP